MTLIISWNDTLVEGISPKGEVQYYVKIRRGMTSSLYCKNIWLEFCSNNTAIRSYK